MRGSQYETTNITEQIIDQQHWKKHRKALKMAETDYKIDQLDPISLMQSFEQKHNISSRYKVNVEQERRKESHQRMIDQFSKIKEGRFLSVGSSVIPDKNKGKYENGRYLKNVIDSTQFLNKSVNA